MKVELEIIIIEGIWNIENKQYIRMLDSKSGN